MNRVARIFVAFGLAAAASTALAAKPPPAQMTEAQMEEVTGGGVVDVLVTNALNDWTINLEVAVQANVLANMNAGVALIGSAQAVQGIVSQLQVTGNLS
jgi:hypothetical protein